MTTISDPRTCMVCGLLVPVVNYGLERGIEYGYLGRHSRPGINPNHKCRGSFGGWVGQKKGTPSR